MSTPVYIARCPCGWTDTFSRGFAGLIIECPRCGKAHRLPTVGDLGADDLDSRAVQRILSRMSDAPETISLRPWLLLSLGICVVAAVLAAALARPFMPWGVVIIGGAASWPLGLLVARWGQRRQARRSANGPV